MEDLVIQTKNQSRIIRFFKFLWVKLFYIYLPMVFMPSLGMLLDEYGLLIYNKIFKKLIDADK